MSENPMPVSSTNKNRGIIAAVVVVVIAVAGYFLIKYNDQASLVDSNTNNNDASSADASMPAGNASQPASSGSSAAQTSPAQSAPAPVSGYKNGSYTVTGKYISPAGPETIKVTLTLTDGVVTASTVVAQADIQGSQEFQEKFINNYKQYVVGKKIDTLQLGKVAGSSLTPKGFNDAVEQIKAQAKS